MARRMLPAEVKNAVVQVCGRSFWYKQPLFDVFCQAGIPENLYLKYEEEAKFKIARKVLGDLENCGEEGYLCQRQLLTELCRFRNIPDPEVTDRDAGLDALRALKHAAVAHDLSVEHERKTRESKKSGLASKARQTHERARKLNQLHSVFGELSTSVDAQARGYGLEELLKELFSLFEIRYRKSYRAEGEQIDGFFSFGGFDYLVEARWRATQPTLQDLLAFKGKVDRKIESTRGLVVSMPGFQDDVVQRFRESGATNLILMDGYDLTLILEGRVNLVDALQRKAEKAAQEGIVYYSLGRAFAR